MARRSDRWSLGTIFLASGMAQSGIQLVLPALPGIQEELGFNQQSISLVTTAYLVPSVLLAFPIGVLADRIGRRRILAVSHIVLGLTGGLLAFVDGSTALIALRILQGVAFASMPALTITMVGDYRTGPSLVRSQGHRFIAMGVSGGVLPLIGGFLASGSWRYVFLAQLAAVPVGIACWLWLDDATDPSQDVRSFWTSLVRSFRDPSGAALQASGFIRFVFKFGFLTYLPILLAARDESLAFIGLALGVNSIAGLVVAGTIGRAAGRVRASTLMSISLVAIAASFGGVAMFTEHWVVLAFCALASLGDSGYGVLQNALVVEHVPAAVRGSFVAAAGAIRNFGKLSAPTVMAAALAFGDVDDAFVLLGVVALLCVVTVVPIRAMDMAFAANNRKEAR